MTYIASFGRVPAKSANVLTAAYDNNAFERGRTQ